MRNICEVCKKEFPTVQGLSLHNRRVHGDLQGNPDPRPGKKPASLPALGSSLTVTMHVWRDGDTIIELRNGTRSWLVEVVQ